jgi:hypothetical protein
MDIGEVSIDSITNAINYLLQQQRADGSWAYRTKGNSSPSLTAQIILTLDELIRKWDGLENSTSLVKTDLQSSILHASQDLSTIDMLSALSTFDRPQETTIVLSALSRTSGIPNQDEIINTLLDFRIRLDEHLVLLNQ